MTHIVKHIEQQPAGVSVTVDEGHGKVAYFVAKGTRDDVDQLIALKEWELSPEAQTQIAGI